MILKNLAVLAVPMILLSGCDPESGSSGDAGTASCGKRIFVTSKKVEPKKGLAAFDAACGTDPNKPSGSGTYLAMVAASGRVPCTTANCAGGGAAENVDWVLRPNTVYCRADGETVVGTTTVSGIFSFPLTHSVVEWTGEEDAVFVLSGSTRDWVLDSSRNCTNWSSPSGNVYVGESSETVAMSGALASCGTKMNLFCVEQ